MDRLTRMLTGLVRGLAGLLGQQRRDWVHALLAEIDDLPSPSARLAWLGGGLWLVVREVIMNRIIQALAFVAGAVGLVWIGWPGAASNSATPVNQMYVVVTLILLAGLPLLVSRYVGPVRPGWAPRLVRVGGYAVVLALIAATAVQFTRGILPAALGTGALTAGLLYALAPFGIDDTAETAAHSLHGGPVVAAGYLVLACFAVAALAVPVAVHAVATRLADRDTRPGILTPARQALLATSGAMATAAILVALFTTLTIAVWPHHFTGAQQPAGDGICPTCEPSTIVIPTNLRHEYSFEATVNGAGNGATALLIVPLIGAALGALRGHLRYPSPAAPPAGLTEGA
jgi:hypothetical protein